MTMIAPLRQPRWLPHVVEYLDAHYTDAVRVRTLATLAGVHPVHLGRVFRQFHRCSVIQYQTRMRIQRDRIADAGDCDRIGARAYRSLLRSPK